MHNTVDFHVRYTHLLHKLDLNKFSISTPKKGTSAYLQIFHPIDGVAPSSERITSDTYYVLIPIKYIVEAKGCIIPDVNNVKNKQKGRHSEDWGSKDTNNGVKRVQMLVEDDYSTILKEKNVTKMHMAQRKCSSIYHIS